MLGIYETAIGIGLILVFIALFGKKLFMKLLGDALETKKEIQEKWEDSKINQ